MSASSESSNPSFSKVTKKPQTSLTISTESELLSNYLSDEILTLSDVGITEIFVNIKECNDPIERDDDMWSELNASIIYDAGEGAAFDVGDTYASRTANYFWFP
ncbi:unnamed protein product, partial [Aphanomyces euteiches]